MWGKLLARSFPHTPFKNSRTNISNGFVSARIDSRRAPCARFCYRERVGTTKTPRAKRVDRNKFFEHNSLLSTFLTGRVSVVPDRLREQKRGLVPRADCPSVSIK